MADSHRTSHRRYQVRMEAPRSLLRRRNAVVCFGPFLCSNEQTILTSLITPLNRCHLPPGPTTRRRRTARTRRKSTSGPRRTGSRRPSCRPSVWRSAVSSCSARSSNSSPTRSCSYRRSCSSEFCLPGLFGHNPDRSADCTCKLYWWARAQSTLLEPINFQLLLEIGVCLARDFTLSLVIIESEQ